MSVRRARRRRRVRKGVGAASTDTWSLIREDFDVVGRRRLHPGWHALVVYRFGVAVHGGTTVRHRVGRVVYRLGRLLVTGIYHIEIPVRTRVGRRLSLPHPHGVVLNGRCAIGDDVMIRHNVTIGAGSHTRGGFPTIGDRVQIGPGAVVMGAVSIGDDVLIGPNAVVVHDVPAGSRVLAPAAVIKPPKDRQAVRPSQGAEDEPHPPAAAPGPGRSRRVPGPRPGEDHSDQAAAPDGR